MVIYNQIAKIIAVCRSKKKGTKKNVISEGFLKEDYGLIGDAHANSNTHRQVSLLAIESIKKMRNLGLDIGPGEFAENLTTEGINLASLPLGTPISIGEDVILKVTQIGKECHIGCAIYRKVGNCIMPQEGVFAKVIRDGKVKAGDKIRLIEKQEMNGKIEGFSIQRVTEKGRDSVEDMIIREIPLTIFLNSQELVTLLCTPGDLKYLAIGFLYSEGLIKDKGEIEKVVLDGEKGIIWVETNEDKEGIKELTFKRLITSGCGKGATFYNVVDATGCKKVQSKLKISPQEIFDLVNEMQHQSRLYRATGGVHSAALCNNRNVLIFSEDIGRHNAIDKIFGECLLKDIQINNRIIITSGRVSSEILFKIARRNIPIIISISAPTNLAVKLANKLKITLIGFARGKRLNIYTNDWRVTA